MRTCQCLRLRREHRGGRVTITALRGAQSQYTRTLTCRPIVSIGFLVDLNQAFRPLKVTVPPSFSVSPVIIGMDDA